jgi:cellulose synthase/poly-beta-1,6-N-acetylglucosamine synthase-like glycosyltransferase
MLQEIFIIIIIQVNFFLKRVLLATLDGSGMAFTTSLYKDCLTNLEISGAGFDKILQKDAERGYRIAFAEKAIVYDEKTSQSDQLVKQRARWLNTWFQYFYFAFKDLYKGILKLNWNQFFVWSSFIKTTIIIFRLHL